MTHDQSVPRLPAPCIIDTGIIVNKEDIRRLLVDLNRVRYIHTFDGKLQSQGEGCLLEVFADPNRATLIANHALYLNIQSFDYLQISQSPEQENYFDLIMENRQLRLIPQNNPLQDQGTRTLNTATLEAMLSQFLSAQWDVQLDDNDFCF